MRNSRKRKQNEDSSSSSSSKLDRHKIPHHHQYPDFNFGDSYNRSTPHLDSGHHVFEESGIRVSPEDVVKVLKLCYDCPGSAVKFFRWTSVQLNDRNSAQAWDLIVDLLGRNCLFEAMWDAIKSMRKEFLLSMATFKSVFDNYVVSDRVQDAIKSFEVMDQYGIPSDVASLNCLLYAICSHGKTRLAENYIPFVKERIRVDAETYTILLEGWEREREVGRARLTFSEMVSDIGWDKRNTRAYDSFLKGDVRSAKVVWGAIVGKNSFLPNAAMYKSLISLYCNTRDFDAAEKLLDEVVYYQAFPDSETYGLLFHCLIQHKRLREAIPVFKEMVKNEFVPMHQD
ncbi:pentatricopeptide repeat-containing protein, mitochondrial [Salvia divinorum]|uniref:Pentatricopeptide repeat-containing protein, mitochondrial n=1 Tax=Salvia divinorum TaxID=28513 RepID=A0ABD1FYQ4_SALDI